MVQQIVQHNRKFTLLICELHNKHMHGFTEESDPNVQGHYLVIHDSTNHSIFRPLGTNANGEYVISSPLANGVTSGNLILQAGSEFRLYTNNVSTSGTAPFSIAPTGAATFITNNFDVLTSSGVGSSLASGLARFITAGSTTAISVGQANSARRLDIQSYAVSVTGEALYLTTQSANRIILETNGINVMQLSTAQNVLINTVSDNGYRLQVEGTLNVSSSARFNGAGNYMEFTTNVLTSQNSDGAHIRSVISTAGNPTYSFQGNQNTGMFNPSSNTIGFTTNGSTKFTIKTNTINVTSIPTSAAGLSSGDIYSNAGILTIVP